MELNKKIELVKSWGFESFTSTSFNRPAPAGYTEWYSVDRPDHIDFADKDGQFSHTYKIDWAIFNK
jgi:hypothetical protein